MQKLTEPISNIVLFAFFFCSLGLTSEDNTLSDSQSTTDQVIYMLITTLDQMADSC